MNMQMLLSVCLAVGAGYILSLFGVIIGYFCKKLKSRRPMDYGAGLSLFLMGIKVLGAPLNSYIIVLPLIIGVFISTLNIAIEK